MEPLDFNLTATLVFVVVTTFTPGPNNLLSTSMGAMYGYRRTLPFLTGVATGFLILMMGNALLSTSLTTWFPKIASALRWVGAAYILWLAIGVYGNRNALLTVGDDDADRATFWTGLTLQFVNPKAWFYGLTIYTTFLAPLFGRPVVLVASPVFLTMVTFAAISTWAIGGQVIRHWISTPARARALAIGLALALVYTALDVAGILGA